MPVVLEAQDRWIDSGEVHRLISLEATRQYKLGTELLHDLTHEHRLHLLQDRRGEVGLLDSGRPGRATAAEARTRSPAINRG